MESENPGSGDCCLYRQFWESGGSDGVRMEQSTDAGFHYDGDVALSFGGGILQ